MQIKNLPTIDGRYWVAIVVASMAGANTGDFAARYLHLGHTLGLVPLALIFCLIVWLEQRSKVATEAYYWLAIIVLRTGATNLADLATHDLKLGYGLTLAGLTVFLIAVLIFERMREGSPETARMDDRPKLPATNLPYWIAMLTAGTLGTAAGDWVADELALGVGWGSVFTGAIFLAVLFVSIRFRRMTIPWYWASIVAARTAGTVMGDFLANRHGLSLGLPISTACTLTLLACIVIFWCSSNTAKSAPF
jgi:uncharacterized membrane-anchored protein